ncbi:uncharacterized protein LOC111005368 isoform X1 [Momordica charantia]|uniref:Uncharacterized protein LOC111005368 isoform X1 n=1 Tax=Momordica charantia TaxID=3673 RepID=A0A6J1BSM4_MOMCH|nr:uncharacterized protein LOC111005368 isoform X1 [Momordica charantia]
MGSEDHQFSDDYLILKPEEATLLDLFLFILPFGFRKIRKLVDCPAAKENSYRSIQSRLIIFVSILFQKLVLAISNLAKKFKLMRGKLWAVSYKPYAPKVNCRDWKIGGEKNVKLPEDNFKYYSALTVMASQLAYTDYSPQPNIVQTVVEGCWKMNLINTYKFRNGFIEKARTCAFMFQTTSTDPNVIILAFKGTSQCCDCAVDVNFSWCSIPGVGRIHMGFMQALGLQEAFHWPDELPKPNSDFAYYTLRQQLRDIAKSNDNARFIFTGHSLGGALAVLFVTILAYHNESDVLEKLQAVYTFGQPRVGDPKFAQFMENTTKKYDFKYYRYVYSFDLVSRIPFNCGDFFCSYKHFGGCVYFDCCYNGKFLEEQPNNNYYWPIYLIPQFLAALWEFIRSLMIPLVKCSWDYFEGFGNLKNRVLGLFIPATSAHMLLNYINSTRYGKIQPSKDIKKA